MQTLFYAFIPERPSVFHVVAGGVTHEYEIGVNHPGNTGTSYQKVSGFDDEGNQFGYEHDVSHRRY